VAEFWLESEECKISLYSKIAVISAEMQEHALWYAAMMTVICITHIYACIRMARVVVRNEIQGFRTSIMTLGYFIGWDMFLCIYHLEKGLTSNVKLFIRDNNLRKKGLFPIFHHTNLCLFFACGRF